MFGERASSYWSRIPDLGVLSVWHPTIVASIRMAIECSICAARRAY